MNGKQLKNSILQWAIQGRLVPQDPTDEPASQLLQRIQAEKAKLVKEGKLKKAALSDSTIFRGEDNKYYEKVGKTITCIDKDIPFEIPQTWEWVRLGDICTFLSRGKSPKYSETSRQYPVFAQKCNLREGGISLSQARFLDPSTITKWDDVYKLRNGDVLVNSTGTGTVGRVRLFNEDCLGDYPFVVPDSHVSVVRTVDEMASEFVFAYLSSKHIQQYLEDNLAGSTNQKELYIGILEDLLLPLPPLAEQRRIVAKVEEVLSVVERYEKAQDELDVLCNSLDGRLRKSILSEAIQGHLVPQDPTDEPASVLLERIRAEKAKLVKEGKLKKTALNDSTIFRGEDNKYYEKVGKTITCIDEDIPFEIPQTWEWVKIGTIFAHNNGKQLNKSNSKGKLLEYITTSNLYWDGFKLDDLKKMPFEEHEIERCQALKGDLLVCEGGDVGRSCIWPYDTPIMLQNHIHKLRAYYPVCTKYFFYVLYEFNLSGRIGGKGIGIQGFSSNALHNTHIPLPPLAEQRRIVAKVEEVLSVVERYEKAQDELDVLCNSLDGRLRKSILSEAIQGHLVPQDPTDEPASVLLERIRAEKAKLVKEGKLKKAALSDSTIFRGEDNKYYEKVGKTITCIDKDIPFEIPQTWEWVRLGNVGEIITGCTPPKEQSKYYGGDIPFFKPTDLEQGKDVRESDDHLTELGFDQARKLPPNSVLVTCIGATIGKTGKLSVYGSCNQQINAIIPNSAVLPDFVYYMCNSNYMQNKIKSKASATTLPILNKNNFSKLLLPLPPLAEQHRIVAKLEELFAVLDRLACK